MRALSKTYPLVLYGAGGATGRLIIEAALAKGVPVLLAGRSPASLSELADRHNLPIATAGIDDPSGLAALAARGSILLNAAGPFAATALPLAQAALAAGTGYLDVSGEVDSLIALQSLRPRGTKYGNAPHAIACSRVQKIAGANQAWWLSPRGRSVLAQSGVGERSLRRCLAWLRPRRP